MPSRSLPRQIVAFAVVGVVNTATYYGLYLLFLIWLPYLAAHALAFTLSMTGSFFLNARFTYRTRPTWRKFLLFPLTNVTNFLITTAGVYVIADILHAGHRFAPLLASAAAIPVTFVVSRRVMLPGARPATTGDRGTQTAMAGDSREVRGTADAA
ncbi:GtrA family protein [Streptomyces sp. NPDC006309]|uniref:GtrA family protein n=1 Tax=Streptomyces sp. NPDC006309 TaxID=3156749 RepID=UPI0033B1DAB9